MKKVTQTLILLVAMIATAVYSENLYWCIDQSAVDDPIAFQLANIGVMDADGNILEDDDGNPIYLTIYPDGYQGTWAEPSTPPDYYGTSTGRVWTDISEYATSDYKFYVDLQEYVEATDSWKTLSTSESASYDSLAAALHISYNGVSLENVIGPWSPVFNAVPEPSTAALFLAGVAFLVRRRRK